MTWYAIPLSRHSVYQSWNELVYPGEPYAHVAPHYVHPGEPYALYVHFGAPYAQAVNMGGHITNHCMMNVPQGTLVASQAPLIAP